MGSWIRVLQKTLNTKLPQGCCICIVVAQVYLRVIILILMRGNLMRL